MFDWLCFRIDTLDDHGGTFFTRPSTGSYEHRRAGELVHQLYRRLGLSFDDYIQSGELTTTENQLERK